MGIPGPKIRTIQMGLKPQEVLGRIAFDTTRTKYETMHPTLLL
jgi:hypothetical protein